MTRQMDGPQATGSTRGALLAACGAWRHRSIAGAPAEIAPHADTIAARASERADMAALPFAGVCAMAPLDMGRGEKAMAVRDQTFHHRLLLSIWPKNGTMDSNIPSHFDGMAVIGCFSRINGQRCDPGTAQNCPCCHRRVPLAAAAHINTMAARKTAAKCDRYSGWRQIYVIPHTK
jgi:hypothetical protein